MESSRLSFCFPYLSVFWLLCSLPVAVQAQAVLVPTAKKILILHSYHQGYLWTDEIQQGIQEAFERAGVDADFYVEYMDTKRFFSATHLENLRKTYADKYAEGRFSLIIASDDNSFNFLEDHRSTLFPGVPIVFCGVNNLDPDRLKTMSAVTGINERVDMRKTIDLALRLHPETQRIAFVTDRTTTGLKLHQEAIELEPAYAGRVEFLHLGDQAAERVARRLSGLGAQDLVLLTVFFRDSDGQTFEFDQGAKLVVDASLAPVYSLWDFYLGFGVIGGLLTSGYHQGEAAAGLALRILDGERADDIPVLMESPNRYIFDFDALERAGLGERKLPAAAIVRNRPESLLEVYKGHKYKVWMLSALLLLMMVLIVFLVVNANQRRKDKDKLAESNRMLESLARFDHLTQIYNRRVFFEKFQQEWLRHARAKRVISLIMCDIDHFKSFNDSHGHLAGDSALKRVAEVLRTNNRSTDIVARYGGEEFVILLPETGLEGAVAVAEQLRKAIGSLAIKSNASHLTASFGVASLVPERENPMESLVEFADRALYQSKRNGRDRTTAI